MTAREFINRWIDYDKGEPATMRKDLEALIAEAVAAEREECALVADNTSLTSLVTGSTNQRDSDYADGFNCGANDASDHIASDIRARSGK